MSNQLKMPKIQSILTLHQQGWPIVRISDSLSKRSDSTPTLAARPFRGETLSPIRLFESAPRRKKPYLLYGTPAGTFSQKLGTTGAWVAGSCSGA